MTRFYRQSILLLLLVLAGCLQICAQEVPDEAPPGMKLICDEETGICYLVPEDEAEASDLADLADLAEFTVERTIVGYQSVDDFSLWLTGDVLQDAVNPLIRNFERYGLIGAALLAILLGLALNLTPCVLPLIPVNLAIIGAKTASTSRGLFLGLMYGIGEALAFGIVGAAFVLFGGMFGAFTQTIWFNGLVAAIFAILGLAMLDIVHIDFSRFRHAGKPNATNSAFGIFLLGTMNALLASACVAPVLIWVLMLSADIFAKGNPLGLILPLMLGIGLGLPWPVLGAGMAKIPRPGAWMNKVKICFSVIIFLAAAYYAMAAWRTTKTTPAPDSIKLEEAVAMSQESGKKILLDFGGPACKNCDVMNATTLKDAGVRRLLDEFLFVSIDASLPENQSLVKRFDIIGLPTYIIVAVPPK